MDEKPLKKCSIFKSSEKCKSKQLWDSTSHQSVWLRLKPHLASYTSKNMEKRSTPLLLIGLQVGTTIWKSDWCFLRKLNIVLPEDSTIPLLGIYPEDSPTCNKDTCSTIFIAALFIIARGWKETRCPSAEEWIQKMWYVYTMEYYSAIKNNEFTKFLGKWMELQNIILSEVI